MAGSYSDVPSRRMSYDHDGTTVNYRDIHDYNDNTWKQPTGAQLEELQDEDDVVVIGAPKWPSGPSWYWLFTFPELREWEGWFSSGNNTTCIAEIEYSLNTTNGYDGTWTTEVADYTDPAGTYANYRNLTYLITQAVPNVKAVRARNNNGGLSSDRKMKTFHIYGVISPGQPATRLRVLDLYDGLFAKDKDYGDVALGEGDITTLKIKNTSPSYIAQNVTIDVEDLYLGSSAWYTLSKDGTNFSSSLSFTSIGTGGQQTFYLKRQISSGFTPTGLHASRLNFKATTWSG